MQPATRDAAAVEPWKWGVVWLLFLATMINYMDRQTLGATSSAIKAEFALDEQGYGWIEFWFGIAFATMQFPAGILADRASVRLLYPAALVVWSAAGFFTGLAESFAALAACRILLGLGEAFNWPCAVVTVGRLIPAESRSLANGIFHSGGSIGAVLTPFVVLALAGADASGWRIVFQVVGAVGVAWVGLWLATVRGARTAVVDGRGPTGIDAASCGGAASVWEVFGLRTFWITLVVSLAVNVTWHVLRVWTPRILQVDLGLDPRWTQWALVAFFLAADVGCMASGWAVRWIARRGRSVVAARKTVMTVNALLGLAAIPAAILFRSPGASLALLCVAGAASMGGFATFFSLSQEISPRHSAFCVGLLCSLAWFVFAVLQPVIGRIADVGLGADGLGRFAPILFAAAVVPLVGAVAGWFWPEAAARDATGARL